jgi:hypothetical protein
MRTTAFIVDRADDGPRDMPWPEHQSYIHTQQRWQWRQSLLLLIPTLAALIAAYAYGLVP